MLACGIDRGQGTSIVGGAGVLVFIVLMRGIRWVSGNGLWGNPRRWAPSDGLDLLRGNQCVDQAFELHVI